jgi:hypothetical protein
MYGAPRLRRSRRSRRATSSRDRFFDVVEGVEGLSGEDARVGGFTQFAVQPDSVIGGADVDGRHADGARCRSWANDRWMLGTYSLDVKLQPAACATAPSVIR